MSAHIPPCDVETNGGDCSCAETWMQRCRAAESERVAFRGVLEEIAEVSKRLEAGGDVDSDDLIRAVGLAETAISMSSACAFANVMVGSTSRKGR